MIEYLVTVKGLVQGVFFRSTVKKLSDHYEIKGWVKNLDNGDVLICLQGNQVALDLMLQNLKKEPGRAIIRELIIEKKELTHQLSFFEILKNS